MNYYPAGVTGSEIDGPDLSLDEVIDNADRKEIRRMIFEYMKPDDEKALLREIVLGLSLKEIEGAIEDYLYDERNLKIARDFIKDNCPEIAE